MAIKSIYLCKHISHPISGDKVSCDVQEVAADSYEATNLVKNDYYVIESKKCPVCAPPKPEVKVAPSKPAVKKK